MNHSPSDNAIDAMFDDPEVRVTDAIAARLVDQSDEPSWTENDGNYAARMNYWRDKAIHAARSLRCLI